MPCFGDDGLSRSKSDILWIVLQHAVRWLDLQEQLDVERREQPRVRYDIYNMWFVIHKMTIASYISYTGYICVWHIICHAQFRFGSAQWEDFSREASDSSDFGILEVCQVLEKSWGCRSLCYRCTKMCCYRWIDFLPQGRSGGHTSATLVPLGRRFTLKSMTSWRCRRLHSKRCRPSC